MGSLTPATCPYRPCGYSLCAEFGPKDCPEHCVQREADTQKLKQSKAPDLMAEALTWIEDNCYGWTYVVWAARRDIREVGRVRIKRTIEEMRDDPRILPGKNGDVVKLKNALSAPFGRILAAWYPNLAEYIPLHRSKCDGCSIPPCPSWARQL